MACASTGCVFGVRSLENAPGNVELEPKTSKRVGSATPWEANHAPKTDPNAFPTGLDVGEDPGMRGWLLRGALFSGGGVQSGSPAFWHFGGEVGLSPFEIDKSNDLIEPWTRTRLHPTLGWMAFRARENQPLSHGRLYGELDLLLSVNRGFGTFRPGLGASVDLDAGRAGPTSSLCIAPVMIFPELCARGTVHFPYSPEIVVTITASSFFTWAKSR
jgi:hypothetical protein